MIDTIDLPDNVMIQAAHEWRTDLHHDPMLPQVNDSCIYQRADDMIKIKGKVMAIAKNGRIRFVPNDTNHREVWLPRRFQKPLRGTQYGLTFVE